MMLRPVRPLRRSADLSRRQSSTSSDKDGACVSSPCTGLQPGTQATVDTTRRLTAAASESASSAATALPPLRPCRLSTSATAANCTGARDSTPAGAFPGPAPHSSSLELPSAQKKGSFASLAAVPANGSSPCATNSGVPAEAEPGCLPASAQRLFTSAEIHELRVEARAEYTRGRRMQERRDLVRDETEQRRLISTDAACQYEALRSRQRLTYEALLRAKAAEGLPLLFLEQRIATRISTDYARQDAELRHEGRALWKAEVAQTQATAVEAEPCKGERRAATHRFRAAITFVVVQEGKVRGEVELEAAQSWSAILHAEQASKVDAEHRALVRFLNTPEQLALAAARERRERRQATLIAKQRKLFEEQQSEFVSGCRHGPGGASVFAGEAPKKVCGRCRLKWDDQLGYLVSLNRAIKVHPPPPPSDASEKA